MTSENQHSLDVDLRRKFYINHVLQHMQRYQNLGGNSAIYAFKIEENLIDVQFRDGAVYRYTNNSSGSTNIEYMKRLALSGRGLNSFISRAIRKNYAAKLR